MKILCLIAIAMTIALPSAARAQQLTPAEISTRDAILSEIAVIDAELDTLRSNQPEFDNSPAMRRDEYESVITRYPTAKVTPTSSASQFYSALIAIRKERAAVARPIVNRMKSNADQALCESLHGLRASFAALASTDHYKRLSLKDRIELRSSIDTLIADYAKSSPPCAGEDFTLP